MLIDKKSSDAPRITLASGSEIRRTLLEIAGVPITIRPAQIDEASIKMSLLAEGAKPRDVADTLAEFKARKSASQGDASELVLGCDQVLALKGSLVSKAETRDAAKTTLQELSGQTHHLYSAAVIYEDQKPVWRSVGTARMTMHALTEREIDSYLEEAWPHVQSSVGCYQAENLGARLFSRIEGDWFSVLGLPLLDVLSYVRLRG